jgi:hypothetical protein
LTRSSLLMRTRHGLVIIAILVISTAPLYAQRQQQDVAKLKADARNTVGIIGGDRAKTRRYCQIVDLTEELDQAIEKKNKKKAKALAEEVVQLQKQLPEYVALSNILEHVDLKSPDGREIALIIQSLIQTCPE